MSGNLKELNQYISPLAILESKKQKTKYKKQKWAEDLKRQFSKDIQIAKNT